MKPLCGFCGGHHDADEGHPAEAVREALAKLRAEKGPGESEFAVGRRTIAEVREHVAAVTETPVEKRPSVTESPVTGIIPAEVTGKRRGRPPKVGALTNAERQRAYRERKET